MRRGLVLLIPLLLVLVPLASTAQEKVDLQMMTRIRQEGLKHSHVMDTVEHLTDVIGPRVTNSPAMREANRWTADTLKAWGLADVHQEPWEFGRGWSFDDCAVDMVEPVAAPLLALPKAWTPGTRGPVEGRAVRAAIESQEDMDRLHGTLAGAVVFLDKPVDIEPPEEAEFHRYSGAELEALQEYRPPRSRGGDWRERAMRRFRLAAKINRFLVDEKVVATVEPSSRDAGLIRVGGNRSYGVGENPGVPGLVMAAEHYDRILRLLDQGREVKVRLDVKARFWENDTRADNTIAEIPGTDLADEVVMAGAHLDSWHGGTGATDDAAGVAVVMEAARILHALGVHPRRTVRIALWSSEEQGLNGSRAYVSQHFASRPEPTDPEQKALPSWARRNQGPLELKPAYSKLSAYFNLDNGGGRIRGIYAQENDAAAPIFAAWLAPFKDLGADTVTLRTTGSTDHVPFDSVGLPGFQFIQDPLDYFPRTHHTNMDVYDRLQPEDLEQASVIMAAFLYDAAMRESMIPRKPAPVEETPEKAGRRTAGGRS